MGLSLSNVAVLVNVRRLEVGVKKSRPGRPKRGNLENCYGKNDTNTCFSAGQNGQMESDLRYVSNLDPDPPFLLIFLMKECQ